MSKTIHTIKGNHILSEQQQQLQHIELKIIISPLIKHPVGFFFFFGEQRLSGWMLADVE